jgi:hypothetical protein
VEIRLRVLTLGAILDVFPIAERWSTLVDLANHWLLNPSEVAYRPSSDVETAMQEQRIKGPKHNARVWWQVCSGVQGRFNGQFRDLLRANSDNALMAQAYLAKSKTTFPVLSGPVISARWLDLVHRFGSMPLEQWEALSVPLSASQQDAATVFGASTQRAHPLVAQSLAVWLRACHSLQIPACDLVRCPRR